MQYGCFRFNDINSHVIISGDIKKKLTKNNVSSVVWKFISIIAILLIYILFSHAHYLTVNGCALRKDNLSITLSIARQAVVDSYTWHNLTSGQYIDITQSATVFPGNVSLSVVNCSGHNRQSLTGLSVKPVNPPSGYLTTNESNIRSLPYSDKEGDLSAGIYKSNITGVFF